MALTILADDLTGACDTGAFFARRPIEPDHRSWTNDRVPPVIVGT